MEGALPSESDCPLSGWELVGKLILPSSNQSENPSDVHVGESPVLELKKMQFRSILIGKTQSLTSWKSQSEG